MGIVEANQLRAALAREVSKLDRQRAALVTTEAMIGLIEAEIRKEEAKK